MLPEVIAPVTAKLSFVIQGVDDSSDLSAPLYAINWFNTPHPNGYRLYNLLIFPLARKMGAAALFKGDVTEHLAGEDRLRRDQLLIVRYPDAATFKRLVSTTWFKLMSLVRTKSTADFTFGYARKLRVDKADANRLERTYLVHGFRGSLAPDVPAKLIENTDLRVTFAGSLTARLVARPAGKEDRPVPCLVDALLVLESESDTALREFVATPAYQEFMAGLTDNYLGLLKRTV